MRTTLDLDPIVLDAAREIARHSRKTIGQVVSEMARKSFEGRTVKAEVRNGIPLFPVQPGTPPITPETIRNIIDEEGVVA